MRSISKKKRLAAVIAAGGMAVAAGGIAYAYYGTSTPGSVNGSAGATNNVLAVTAGASTISGLYPGSSQVTTVTLHNPNSYNVSIGSKTVAVSAVAGPAGCTDNTVALLSGSNTVNGVIAGLGDKAVDVTVAMANSASVDQTPCTLGGLTVTYSIS